MYTCRECERPINQASEVCPYCGADLTGSEPGEEEILTGKQHHRRIIKRWVLWGTLVAAIWGFLWFVLPERASHAAAEAEKAAVAALRVAAGTLREYAEARGRYPESLDSLSGEALTKVRRAAQEAQRRGYQLEYSPGPAEADGVVRTYALLARAGHFGYRNFFTNETGVIRWTSENRPATAGDSPI